MDIVMTLITKMVMDATTAKYNLSFNVMVNHQSAIECVEILNSKNSLENNVTMVTHRYQMDVQISVK